MPVLDQHADTMKQQQTHLLEQLSRTVLAFGDKWGHKPAGFIDPPKSSLSSGGNLSLEADLLQGRIHALVYSAYGDGWEHKAGAWLNQLCRLLQALPLVRRPKFICMCVEVNARPLAHDSLVSPRLR